MTQGIRENGRFPMPSDRSGTGSIGSVIVKPGDNLKSIAQSLNVSIQDLRAANPHITDPNLVRPGMELFLPQPGTAAQSLRSAQPMMRYERTQSSLFQSVSQLPAPSAATAEIRHPGLEQMVAG